MRRNQLSSRRIAGALIAVAAGLLACVSQLRAAAHGNATNLLQDGGFEVPIVPRHQFKTVTSETGVGAWQIQKGGGTVSATLALNNTTYQYNGFEMKSHSGGQSLNLAYSSTGIQPGILQTVPGIVGHRYRLDFWTGNLPNPPQSLPCAVEVLINTDPLGTVYNDKTNKKDQHWEHFSMTFTAHRASIEANIIDGTPKNGPPSQCGLDDVTLTDLDAASPPALH
jgi:hypothetical protein